MSATKNTIAVWTNNPTRKEATAGGAITPGMHVSYSSATAVVAGAVGEAEAPKPLLIAEENELEGQEITDAYASGDRVFFRAFYPGDQVSALLADGETATATSYLTPHATAGLWKVASGTDAKVLQCREAKDLSASANTTNDYVIAEVC